MEYRVMDYEKIRKAGDLVDDETIATVSLVQADVILKTYRETKTAAKKPPPDPESE